MTRIHRPLSERSRCDLLDELAELPATFAEPGDSLLFVGIVDELRAREEPKPPPVPELAHAAIRAFTAACGADVPNQLTTWIAANVTCKACLALRPTTNSAAKAPIPNVRYLGAAHAYAHGVAIGLCPCSWDADRVGDRLASLAENDPGPAHIDECPFSNPEYVE
jgi:hypothetical protein